ncbi:hypothetical protein CW745_01240 [Psychromonas sp. psych-6C06]|uniref:hypothetical protein n=1 Tax=Psychromonas sp. psych-6C06 TaxID=2058089 RepID=UPI000C349D0B|nr:hypothetical protein [Psychromonas sp. psych-6C06]PKF63504.1 hypothetical protein CW745_01240 [Psychromonas sp. psych-6C06]
MYTSQVVKDRAGQCYIVCLRNSSLQTQALKPEKFVNAFTSFQFVTSLQAPFGFWQRLATSNTLFNLQRWQNSNPTLTIEHYAAEALAQGFVQVYKTADVQTLNQQAHNARVKDNFGRGYQLQPATSLLLNHHQEIKSITSRSEALQLIDKLSLDDDAILKMLEANKINIVKAPSEELVTALVDGELVVSIMPPARKPVSKTDFIEEVISSAEPAPATTNVASSPKRIVKAESTRNDKTTAEVLEKAAEAGTPFCEECQKDQAA